MKYFRNNCSSIDITLGPIMLREFSCNRKELDKGGNYVFQGGKDGCSLSRIKIKRVPYPWNPPSFESSSALSQWRTASQKERLSYRVLFNYGKRTFPQGWWDFAPLDKSTISYKFSQRANYFFLFFFFFLGKHLLQIHFFFCNIKVFYHLLLLLL